MIRIVSIFVICAMAFVGSGFAKTLKDQAASNAHVAHAQVQSAIEVAMCCDGETEKDEQKPRCFADNMITSSSEALTTPIHAMDHDCVEHSFIDYSITNMDFRPPRV